MISLNVAIDSFVVVVVVLEDACIKIKVTKKNQHPKFETVITHGMDGNRCVAS